MARRAAAAAATAKMAKPTSAAAVAAVDATARQQRTTRASRASAPSSSSSPSIKSDVKKEANGSSVEQTAPKTPPRKRVKREDDDEEDDADKTDVKTPKTPSANGSARKPKMTTSEKKLASLRASLDTGPFPDWHKPTAEQALEVANILTEAHGYKSMPVKQPPRGDDRWGGCGDVASVLDATVRTILSCNTSGANSRNAHRSMCERFGKNNWQAILDAKHSEVADSIRCGGLHEAKAKTIQGVLRDTMERHGKLSLDHLHTADSRQVMEELVSFNGVGPKVASCVSAFCIGKEEMAVDTHVHRLCKKLGWVPEKASRDQTYYHLYERIPGQLKYPLHVLLIKHGKACSDCSARGFATDRYQSPSWKDEGMSVISGVKPEDIDKLKEEAQDKKFEKIQCPLRAAGLFSNRKSSGARTSKKAKLEAAAKEEELEDVPTVKQEPLSNGIKQEV